MFERAQGKEGNLRPKTPAPMMRIDVGTDIFAPAMVFLRGPEYRVPHLALTALLFTVYDIPLVDRRSLHVQS